LRQYFEIDQEKLRLYNEGRFAAHVDNRCAFCKNDLNDLRKIYCNSRCRRRFRSKYRYLTNSWAATRWKALRRDNFLCVPCLKEGKMTRSRIVDHIMEIADGGPEFEISNTQTICKEHHRIKTAENRRLRTARKKIIAAS
jgi:5-methylcytosine-specific restriction endonuclease McrA